MEWIPPYRFKPRTTPALEKKGPMEKREKGGKSQGTKDKPPRTNQGKNQNKTSKPGRLLWLKRETKKIGNSKRGKSQ